MSNLSGSIVCTIEFGPFRKSILFSSVYLKGTELGCTTDEKGLFHLKVPEGQYTLVVSAVGYQTVEHVVQAKHGERQRLHIHLSTDVKELDEVIVVSNGVSRVKKSAFNAIALDTKVLQNSTQNLSEALAQAPGNEASRVGRCRFRHAIDDGRIQRETYQDFY